MQEMLIIRIPDKIISAHFDLFKDWFPFFKQKMKYTFFQTQLDEIYVSFFLFLMIFFKRTYKHIKHNS